MNENTATPRRLYRSRRDRMLAGVAGGLGQYFNIDPVLIRLAFVAMTLASGIGLVIYVILAIVVPNRPEYEEEPQITSTTTVDTTRGREIAGIILIGFGLLVLASNVGLFAILRWDLFWPIVLIGLGAYILMNRVRE